MLPEVIASLSLISVIITTYILTYQTSNLNQKFKRSFSSLVDDINKNQQIELNFDKKQYNSINALNSNVDDIRSTYERRDSMANQIYSKNLVGNNISGDNYDVNSNISFYNTLPESSSSMDYTMGRGLNNSTKDRLIINTPNNSKSGFDITSTGGLKRFSINGQTGDINIPGNIYNDGNTNIVGNISGSNALLRGNLSALGINLLNNATIKGDGSLNISNKDKLILSPSNGVYISQESGGNGNLLIDGDIVINGNTNVNNINSIGMITANGVTIPNNITITNADPGPMMQKQYGSNQGNVYGIGQFANGTQRMYATNQLDQSSVNLSLVNNDGTFDDVLSVKHNGGNKSLLFGGTGSKIALSKNNGDFTMNTNDPTNKLYLQNGSNSGIVISENNIGINTVPQYAPLDIAGNISIRGTDLILNKGDLTRGNSGAGRAFVKDVGNQLAINYSNDFIGGTRIDGDASLNGQVFLNNNNLNLQNNHNSGLLYDSNIDGPTLYGNSGGRLATNGENLSSSLEWDDIGNIYTNNLKISSNWTGYPDTGSQFSEIANDTSNYKQLMIVGNKSAGGQRQIGMWDNININGLLSVNGSSRFNGDVSLQSNASISGDGRIYLSSGEMIYLQPKSGVLIAKNNGSTGTLTTQGDIKTNGKFCINNTCITEAQLSAIKKQANA